MIRAAFHRRRDQWIGFVISGHAGLADSGQDIVCAAVSALSQGALIGLEHVVGITVNPVISEHDGYLECSLPPGLSLEKQRESHIILETLYLSLRSIEAGHEKALVIAVHEQPAEVSISVRR